MLNSRQGTNKSVMRKVRNVSDTLIVEELIAVGALLRWWSLRICLYSHLFSCRDRCIQ